MIFLGHGLNGNVYVKRTKLKAFTPKSFILENANVAFPNTENVFYAKQIKDRNGSISGNILKRFNIIFNYQKAQMNIPKTVSIKKSLAITKAV